MFQNLTHCYSFHNNGDFQPSEYMPPYTSGPKARRDNMVTRFITYIAPGTKNVIYKHTSLRLLNLCRYFVSICTPHQVVHLQWSPRVPLKRT
ncbi:hypothetical protein Hanom_Chr07g00611491 [Helianthus anomalus]